jgi:pimeloyl-ACP methyl ester carboxylesterase
MARMIIFIHGAWVTPLCWEKFIPYFEGKGYTCLAPAWPHKDLPVERLRSNPPSDLIGMGVTEIVDHYAKIIRSQTEAPILIGHSFGGLFVQMLLDRGLGSAGIAIDSAPPKGVIPMQWSVYKANANVLLTWQAWKHIVYMSFPDFQYAFVNTLPPAEQKEAYDRHVIPETGRIFFQAGLALLDSHNATRVNFKNNQRAPLLLIAGGADHIITAKMIRSNTAKYKASSAQTDYKEFAGRAHWIIAQEGWQEVAEYCREWLESLSNNQ